MAGLPDITIVGTLTADPEMRFTQTGTGVVTFTVAANNRYLDKQTNQWTDGDTTFMRCSMWREYAENVAHSFRKGQRVIVLGALKQRSYEDQDGNKRTVFEVDAREAGPALKWATADIKKATRTTSRTASGNDDPWATAPAPAPVGAGYSSEPPF